MLETRIKLHEEVQDYFKNQFVLYEPNKQPENNVVFWENRNEAISTFSFLQTSFPQLLFPIQAGINETIQYRNAVYKGKHIYENQGLALNEPEKIECFTHKIAAIKAVVVVVPNTNDFIKIIQALAYKNQPKKVPDSTGAMLIRGLNNWAKIKQIKNEFRNQMPQTSWPAQFSKLVNDQKHLYQDEIIILSKKPYSNVSATSLGVSEESWLNISLQIRLAHEFAHLFTLKNYGGMYKNLHDELLADYIGICNSVGTFQKEWMLHFMGIENYPSYKAGARLENYVPKGLQSIYFQEIMGVMKQAIEQLFEFDSQLHQKSSLEDETARMRAICETNVLTIASENGNSILFEKYNHFLQH